MKAMLVLVVLLLPACAPRPYVNPYLEGNQSHSAGNTTESTIPVRCKDKADCDLKWQKAQIWVANNGRWKIQISNDTLIQTFGPGDSIDSAYTVTRLNQSDGSGVIDIKAQCGNIFGCVPSNKQQEQAFRNNLN